MSSTHLKSKRVLKTLREKTKALHINLNKNFITAFYLFKNKTIHQIYFKRYSKT